MEAQKSSQDSPKPNSTLKAAMDTEEDLLSSFSSLKLEVETSGGEKKLCLKLQNRVLMYTKVHEINPELDEFVTDIMKPSTSQQFKRVASLPQQKEKKKIRRYYTLKARKRLQHDFLKRSCAREQAKRKNRKSVLKNKADLGEVADDCNNN